METPKYDRDAFLAAWAKMLKCENNVFAISACLVNQYKNFQTAAAVLFGLSVQTHKEYILGVEKYWKANWPEGSTATAEWCMQFQQHYVDEVVPYPSDA